jgi:serine/threonine-protein phosphatase 2A regulatory subunit A
MATAEEMREVRALIEQLRGKDKAARLAATRQMTRISIVLGPERCRNELIPYVLEGVTEVEDDEEILLAVADALGEPALFAALGDQAILKMLISALEPFLAFDNPNVRDRAVASIKNVLAALPPRDVQGDGVSLIRHLAASEFFGPRVAAPPLLVELYASLSKGAARETDGLRRELRFSFCALCADDSPVVRKSAASALSQLLPLLELSEISGEVYPVFQKVCQDPQDSVRISRFEFLFLLFAPRTNAAHLNAQCGKHSCIVAHQQRNNELSSNVTFVRTVSGQVSLPYPQPNALFLH